MAQEAHESNVSEIWKVFGILTVITIVEVALGIIRPAFLDTPLFGYKILNWIFIGLTILKAYYIVYYFMHAKYEKMSFRASFLYPFVIFATYATFIFLAEGHYLHEIVQKIQWEPREKIEVNK